jgi:hypothetical protein
MHPMLICSVYKSIRTSLHVELERKHSGKWTYEGRRLREKFRILHKELRGSNMLLYTVTKVKHGSPRWARHVAAMRKTKDYIQFWSKNLREDRPLGILRHIFPSTSQSRCPRREGG